MNFLKSFRSHKKLYLPLMVVLYLMGCHGYEPIPNDDNPRNFLAGKNDCPSVIGTYEFYGEALPGMPNYYRFKNAKLAIDNMLGRDLHPKKRGKASEVEFLDYQGLEVIFRGADGEISRKPVFFIHDRVQCVTNKIIILRQLQGYGEAVTGTVDSKKVLFLDENGHLIIEAKISGRSRSLFFSWDDPPEEYSARFRKTPKGK